MSQHVTTREREGEIHCKFPGLPTKRGRLAALTLAAIGIVTTSEQDEPILHDNPLDRPSSDQASPRIQSVFRDVRRESLPKIVMERYAAANREAMMDNVIAAMRRHLRPFQVTNEAVNCHHNYVQRERHFGERVWVTRKGAIRAGAGELGIIPGSMGAKSYIVRGRGSAESFESCAHGAGRRMSRSAAQKRFTSAIEPLRYTVRNAAGTKG